MQNKSIESKCDNCNGTEFEILMTSKNKVSDKYAKDISEIYSADSSVKLNVDLIRCKFCSLVTAHPKINEQQVLELYRDSDSKNHANQSHNRIKSFNVAINKLSNFVNKKTIENVLDIGCAGGEFLKCMKDAGYEVYGIEPSVELSKLAQEKFHLDVEMGSLAPSSFKGKNFDLITMWDVLEHVNYPKLTLINVRKRIKEGGYLLLNLPMIDTFPARILGKFWPFYLDVHFYYYTMKTINALTSDLGFELIYSRKYFQSLSVKYLMQRQFGKNFNFIPDFPLKYYLGQRTLLFRKC